MYQMCGVFAEFERAMITERVKSGLAKARANGTRSGRPIGRPRIPEAKRQAICDAYAAGGIGMRPLAKRFGVSFSTVKALLGVFAEFERVR
jgi:DNA invertase Pin-like site-specific DNA recombinase